MMKPTPVKTNWLIWDGDCTFCGNAVTWFSNLDQEQQFRIVPAQIAPSPPMTPGLVEEARRSMIVITDEGRVILGGSAVLHILEQVGWHVRLMRLCKKPPLVWAVNIGYRIVANNRQFFSRILFPNQPGCQVRFPQDEQRP